MKTLILRIISIFIIVFGIFLVIKPAIVAEKLKSFYSGYPLVRYAGERQLTSRPQFIIVVGIVIIIVGLICFWRL
jgi:uncharacterized membrane protein HdeD (DUF308 family)